MSEYLEELAELLEDAVESALHQAIGLVKFSEESLLLLKCSIVAFAVFSSEGDGSCDRSDISDDLSQRKVEFLGPFRDRCEDFPEVTTLECSSPQRNSDIFHNPAEFVARFQDCSDGCSETCRCLFGVAADRRDIRQCGKHLSHIDGRVCEGCPEFADVRTEVFNGGLTDDLCSE